MLNVIYMYTHAHAHVVIYIVAPAGTAGGGASSDPYGAGWVTPLIFQQPGTFPSCTCAVATWGPHVATRKSERVFQGYWLVKPRSLPENCRS